MHLQCDSHRDAVQGCLMSFLYVCVSLDSDLGFSEFLKYSISRKTGVNVAFQILISEYSILSHIINLHVRYDVLGSNFKMPEYSMLSHIINFQFLNIPFCRIPFYCI